MGMGKDSGLDFDKICEIGWCPRTTAFPFRDKGRSSVASGRSRRHRRDDLLVLNEEFLEINFGKYRSGSCKSVQDSSKGIQGGLEVNRCSVYESSAEVGRMSKFEGIRRRRKIEMPRGSDTSSCLSIVDSLCSSDDEVESNRSSAISRCSQAASMSRCGCGSQPGSAEGPRRDRETLDVPSFSKSFSVKAERRLPSPFVPESHRSSLSGSRTRFSLPMKKMLDPLVKSKSSRSPLSRTTEDPAVDQGNKSEECRFRVCSRPSTKGSPVQLHGILERKENRGVPSFKFSLDCPEEALVAKTCKEDNFFNPVYTFHSLDDRKVPEDRRGESLMVGQMQVSCCISSELGRDSGSHDSSVTEFVLYDTAHVRTSSPKLVGRTNRVDDISGATKLRHGTKRHTRGRDRCPLGSMELRPELEVAAVVVHVPYEKRDHGVADSVNVIIPAGNHGSPDTEGSGPSSLLERWRTGGGCDCGGWDMACPLVVLGNPSLNFEDRILVDGNNNPLRLLIQGTKDRVPALTMKFLQDGSYEVNFHALLSSLQAFSICVAMLHSVEAVEDLRDENRGNPRSRASPETIVVAEEAVDPIRKMVRVAPSYLIKPPFSPIARV